MQMTIAEKILARAAKRKSVSPGDIVEAGIDVAMINDITGPITVDALEQIGVKRVWDPSRVVIILDHQAPATLIEAAQEHSLLRRFAASNKIDNFFDVNQGVCHEVLPEQGFALPGELIVGADSHTCTYGAFGCFATGIGSTDMAAVFATGELWFRVPESVGIKVNGALRPRVAPKDIILKVIGDIGADGATYRAVEFSGSGTGKISVGGRMTMCNMGVEMGAKAAIIPADGLTRKFLEGRARWSYTEVCTDDGANYVDEREYDLPALEPQVAVPHNVDNVRPVREVAGVKVDQAFLGSCTNGRLEDLVEAAKILKGRKIARGVRMLVAPASKEVYSDALGAGVLQQLIDAGAMIAAPSCAACMGGHIGILAPGEACISSSNRNFRGRMGSPEAKVYLGSPATVAASALKGEITDPRDV